MEQLIRPTGLIDPEVEIHPIDGQIDDLISRINDTADKEARVLATTLTKKMAESLTAYLTERHIKVKYMHSDVDTPERVEIIAGLRRGEFDVLVGINLLESSVWIFPKCSWWLFSTRQRGIFAQRNLTYSRL